MEKNDLPLAWDDHKVKIKTTNPANGTDQPTSQAGEGAKASRREKHDIQKQIHEDADDEMPDTQCSEPRGGLHGGFPSGCCDEDLTMFLGAHEQAVTKNFQSASKQMKIPRTLSILEILIPNDRVRKEETQL